MSIVPGYATSTGGGTAACAVEAANGGDSARATASDRLARYERRMRRFLRFSGQSPSSPGLDRSSPCHWAWWCGGTGKRQVDRAFTARNLLSPFAAPTPQAEPVLRILPPLRNAQPPFAPQPNTTGTDDTVA